MPLARKHQVNYDQQLNDFDLSFPKGRFFS